ncbi:SDR family NAD(P)-dependent oxidoreductase [Pseudorhodobacter sp. E13]|uniref:SDR family NAD(P)-dependent oxidoreductase n=1 Tax=Pseudorhodobacter sp. E13 TaxID=2487931 RepID=UPI000F8DA80F|nr:SDR family NAD(P)-dependent oxidoreductase [Pseudorhodobacter sp. E13]RUS60283.1 SDR family NAD(P)-dependent oxidoreductase [Pseudorhodobacter sp. E13]
MSQKSILITGCSSGIGLDAARTLHARGWRVFATCRAEADCARLRGEGLESFRLDYDDVSSLESAVAEVMTRTGGTLDALFNNGAYAIPCAYEDLPRDAFRAILETNLIGYHDLTCRVLPIMRAQGHGRIVNNSSILGMVGFRWRTAYVATKFALEGITDVLRLELRGTGIHPILIEPGPITTKFRDNSAIQFKRWIKWDSSPRRAEYAEILERFENKAGPDRFELPASAVTDKLIHALESKRPRARYYVTIPTHVMGIARRLLPIWALDRILAGGT